MGCRRRLEGSVRGHQQMASERPFEWRYVALRVGGEGLTVSGQGVWYALTHRPDKIIAAAAVSGYSSIQGECPCLCPVKH